MAGIQWKGGKLTLGKFVATQRHNARDTRMRYEHSNPHLDTDKTADNWSALSLTYEERLARLNKRLDEIDTGRTYTGKNERVVAQSLIAYCPPEVTAAGTDAERRFFEGFWDICAKRFGADNIIDMDVHTDEVHDYVDPDTHEVVTSRVHCHLDFVPVVTKTRKRKREAVMVEDPETGEMVPARDKAGRIKRRYTGYEEVELKKPKLEANTVATAETMRELNEAVDAMCLKEFGVHYMTGRGTHPGRSVESLKIESARAAEEKAEAAQKAAKEAAAKANAAQKAAEAAESGRQAAEKARVKAKAELDKTLQEAKEVAGDSYVNPEDGKRYYGLAGVRRVLHEETPRAKAAMERRKELEARNAELSSKNDELADEVERTRARHKAMAEAIVRIQAELDAAEARRKAAAEAADAAEAARARADEARREAESATKAAEAQRVEIENARQRAQEALYEAQKRKDELDTEIENIRAQKASQDAREAALDEREAKVEENRGVAERLLEELRKMLEKLKTLFESSKSNEIQWAKDYVEDGERLREWYKQREEAVVCCAAAYACKRLGADDAKLDEVMDQLVEDYVMGPEVPEDYWRDGKEHLDEHGQPVRFAPNMGDVDQLICNYRYMLLKHRAGTLGDEPQRTRKAVPEAEAKRSEANAKRVMDAAQRMIDIGTPWERTQNENEGLGA